MISICIPVYNCKVQNLTTTLLEQGKTIQTPFEIILIDDGSKQEFKDYNSCLDNLNPVRYIELNKNIGRSAIRNLFVEFARYDCLLFLDCDSETNDSLFLANYLDAIENDVDVICGGRLYMAAAPDKFHRLRWQYGLKRECKPVALRNKNPYQSFLSNNFLIKKRVLNEIRFDERIIRYGHEDTLFGTRLKQNKCRIKHIDNGAIHRNYEDANEFLQKTRQAIENLYFIYKMFNQDENFVKNVKLLHTFLFAQRTGMKKILALIYRSTGNWIENFFAKGKTANLFLFDFYRICYLCYFASYKYELKNQTRPLSLKHST